MSDLLSRFKSEVKTRVEWGLCRLSYDVSLSVDECKAIVTALQALEDLETLVTRYGTLHVRSAEANEYLFKLSLMYGQTIPAALRAAVEAIKKGETE